MDNKFDLVKRYSYARISIGSHGYMVNVLDDSNYMYEIAIEIDSKNVSHVYLLGTTVSIGLDDLNQLIVDERMTNTTSQSYIMVYASDILKAEVMNMIKPQLQKVLDRYINLYQKLMDNAREMYSSVAHAFPETHFCAVDQGDTND